MEMAGLLCVMHRLTYDPATNPVTALATGIVGVMATGADMSLAFPTKLVKQLHKVL